jgi:negative regulator of sigma E activity
MATADERRESRKKTGQANQAAGKYKSVAPSEAAVKNTTYNDPSRQKDRNNTNKYQYQYQYQHHSEKSQES